MHFLGWNASYDTKIGRISSDIQQVHTFTTPWREALREDSIVEVRQHKGNWDTCVVLAVENLHNQHKIGAAVVSGADKKYSGPGGDENDSLRRLHVARVNDPEAQMWVDADGENVCQEGTHVRSLDGQGGRQKASSRRKASPDGNLSSASSTGVVGGGGKEKPAAAIQTRYV